jgi:acyl-CoA thioesterase FadM
MRFEYQVAFHDVDYARVLFFARFYEVVQRANDDWMRQHGLSYQRLFGEAVGTPIAASFCRYVGPVYVEDTLVVTLGVWAPSPRGFWLVFDIWKAAPKQRVAWGYIQRRFVDAERRAHDAPPHVVARYAAMAAESDEFVTSVWQPLWERERARLLDLAPLS